MPHAMLRETLLPANRALVTRPERLFLYATNNDVSSFSTKNSADARDVWLGPDPVLICHGPVISARLGAMAVPTVDVLELFAFVRPGEICQPTPRGLAAALNLGEPASAEAEAKALIDASISLMHELARTAAGVDADPIAGIAWSMARAGWPWGPAVLTALGREDGGPAAGGMALRIWQNLPEWQAEPPPPPPRHDPVQPDEAERRLAQMLGQSAESRPPQVAYAKATATAFQVRTTPGEPAMVVAEAGTGVGKTMGYLASASLWAERNGAPVWISTYTRNLQHQIDRELDRLPATRREQTRRVVVRKGRENYLCLLSFEELVAAGLDPTNAIAAGLMARWASVTRDGDLTGRDFPGWLVELLGPARTLGLADRRGECIHSACAHYTRCYIERSIRRARRADIVVANHALAMIQAALGGLDDGRLPSRYVFDEGHHLFDAADSAFSAHLSGQEMAELRRWLIGGGRGGRARGLRRRLEDALGDDPTANAALDAVEAAARSLCGDGWLQRATADNQPESDLPTLDLGTARSAPEAFLALVRRQVRARARGLDGPHDLETDTSHPVDGLTEAAAGLDRLLARLERPLATLADRLRQRLNDEAEELDSATRARIDAQARGIDWRGRATIGTWRSMLADLGGGGSPDTVDWFTVDRGGPRGRESDIGYHRHWIDPMVPFATSMASHAHGVVVTSASLTDGTGDESADWLAADQTSGARHFTGDVHRVALASPYDYPSRTRVMVITDVRKDDLAQVAAAYRVLFKAAGGGALGLFTAISRLRGVHARLAGPMEAAGLPLLAQHVDAMGVATLVDIFRAEENACLLGTDAVRDGVDVPGRSLRLIVFDRVPWPRPSILHRARRDAFGGRAYDDRLVRLRLKQAFGRLVRRSQDCGVFVMLDPMMPSRLAGAFPDGVEIQRIGLADAARQTHQFLTERAAPTTDAG